VKRHSGERGAALFVVVLVITLLTAIGVFAMHATSLAQLGSGYSRRASAAFYLAELGANLRTATISDDTNKYNARGNSKIDQCYESRLLNPQLPANAATFCVVMDRTEAASVAQQSNSSLASDPEGFFGALSRPDIPADQAVSASLRVESTDHHLAVTPIAGMAIGGSTQIFQDTITVNGSLTPTTAAGSECTATVTRASEVQRLRGFVTYVLP
jgi:hypothetical protein